MGLLSSDETILVNIESVPSLLEVSLHVAWNLGALKFVSSLKNDTSGLWGSLFHKDLLSILDTVVVFSLS